MLDRNTSTRPAFCAGGVTRPARLGDVGPALETLPDVELIAYRLPRRRPGEQPARRPRARRRTMSSAWIAEMGGKEA